MATNAERLQKLEQYVSEQDNSYSRQIVHNLTSSLRLSLSASEADVLSKLSADLLKKNREFDIVENCLKVQPIHYTRRLMRGVKKLLLS